MSIRKIRKNVYRIEIDLIIDGKRYRPNRKIETMLTGRQLKALQSTVEAELETELRQKLDDKEKLLEFTLRDLYKWYINKMQLEQHSIDYYTERMENRTIDFFKNKKACNVTYEEAEDYLLYLDRAISKKTGKPLSQKTKKHYLTVLHAIFKEYKRVLHRKHVEVINPFEGLSVKMPSRSVKGKFYGPTVIKQQMQALSDHGDTELYLMYVLTLLGGLRPAELRGLRWGKIDWDRSEMLIDMTLTKTKIGDVYKTTKNDEPRTIYLIPLAITLLRSHYENESQKRKRMKIRKPMKNRYVFTNEKGEILSEGRFRREWKKFCEAHGFEYKPPYDLRHSTATLLAYKKVPKPNIKEQLGHLDEQTTDIYIHAVEEVKDEIKEIMEDTLSTKTHLYIVNE